jgi:hypothetical protein
VPTKLEHLSEADRAYVKELTYKPREVTVVFGVGASGLAEEERRLAAGYHARHCRAAAVRTAGAQKAAERPVIRGGRSRSVDVLGNRILPRRAGRRDAVDRGRFVFVSYRWRTIAVSADGPGARAHRSA